MSSRPPNLTFKLVLLGDGNFDLFSWPFFVAFRVVSYASIDSFPGTITSDFPLLGDFVSFLVNILLIVHEDWIQLGFPRAIV